MTVTALTLSLVLAGSAVGTGDDHAVPRATTMIIAQEIVEETDETAPPSRTVQLHAGWNLVGWTAAISITEAVTGLAGEFTAIATYDADADVFRFFRGEDAPAALNTLRELALGDGVWISVPQPTTWTQPEPRLSREVPLRAGFNLIAWTGPNRTPVREAVAGIRDAVRAVWTFDAGTQTFLRHHPQGIARFNDPIVLDYGDGLWLEMADDASWKQPRPHSVARQWDEELLATIRLDVPAPTVHARNLFHLSVALYDAWAAYDAVATGYWVREKVSTTLMTARAAEAAREEAISYAAYRVLVSRFTGTIAAETTLPRLDARMDALGYDRAITQVLGASPAALGNRVAAAVIAHGLVDGANQANGYVDDTGYLPVNEPLVLGFSGARMRDPNRWQPLTFTFLILQNDIVVGEATQTFIGPHWGGVTPFALRPTAADAPFAWSDVDPGPPPQLGGEGDAAFKDGVLTVIRQSSWLSTDDAVRVNPSPAVSGQRPLGTHDDQGYPTNPITGEPYAPHVVSRGDYGRVIAEFWADGPASETPPGHWNVLANDVSYDAQVVKQIAGMGRTLNQLEWDIKLYVALNGALHDAAIAGWGSKAVYDYSRPISMIRHMGERGQSSEPAGPSFHAEGLPLEAGLIEVITAQTAQPGGRHAHLAGQEGEIAIRAWSAGDTGESSGVGWIRAVDWMPYQADTFVTPSFAAYVSGHSAFSRAAAEVLTAFTGSAFFPGGLGE